MGICSRRHFLLTICSLQLLTTIERQVFDFLGFMWAPILVNFFNIIFVILGFFGAFQYRPKYIISYCVWNTLWLGWNIFAICFYLDVGILDKKTDLLNFHTGSFSWWYTNGPGCKNAYEITEPEIYRPARPTNVTDCVLSYEIIEVLHASTQCILGLMAIVGGICLSRVFLEEDDSFDFVGGGDFGLAGHTPLHPMYVSYSALPPPVYSSINSAKNHNNRDTMSTQRSYALSDDNNASSLSKLSNCQNSLFENRRVERLTERRIVVDSDGMTARIDSVVVNENDRGVDDNAYPRERLDRSMSPCEEYDSLEDAIRTKYRVDVELKNSTSSRYSPVVTPRMRRSRLTKNSRKNNNRNSAYKPRIFIDHVREQPLRTFYSDPRLAIDQQSEMKNRPERNSRPLSLYGNNS